MAAQKKAEQTVDVLLLGSGGREHTLLRALAKSARAGKLWVAPGNGGMLQEAQAADCDICDPASVALFAASHHIGLVVIGPEAPLVAGVADAVRAAHIPCFGPDEAAARLEGSKQFAKEIMDKAGVPTAKWRSFTKKEPCLEYAKSLGAPLVIKADGLAAGKGVFVADELDSALEAIEECFGGRFGEAGATVIVEEKLEGPECSLLALTDGKTLVPLATSQDHKRAFDGDMGPNTGGMGAYSPVPFVNNAEFNAMVDAEKRVIDQLQKEGIRYSGCLYGGFMLTQEGPKVLEFNARFGDPETQAVLPRLKGDLIDIFLACDKQSLSKDMIGWDKDCAACVVLASKGYPGAYEKGKLITGIKEAESLDGVSVFHAGTCLKEGNLVTDGGRVLGVTAVAPTFAEAQSLAYKAADLIQFEGKTYRHDIGAQALVAHDASYSDAPTVALGKAGQHDVRLEEKILSEDIVWRGKIFDVDRLHVELPDKRQASRDIVRHPGAAAVVALTDDGCICLVRQYRTALDRVTVEIPAGKLDAGEDPLACATRELEEETGFVADKIAFLTTIASSCGFSDELIHIYMATGLHLKEANPDADEFIDVDLVPLSEFIDSVLDGRIEDAKTVVGALICDAVSRRLNA